MSEFINTSLEILRRREVEAKTGLSRSSIYQRIREKEFPMPISLGAQSVGWIKSEIEEWIAERIRRSRPPAIVLNDCDRGTLQEKRQ